MANPNYWLDLFHWRYVGRIQSGGIRCFWVSQIALENSFKDKVRGFHRNSHLSAVLLDFGPGNIDDAKKQDLTLKRDPEARRNMFGIKRIIPFATVLLRIWWSLKGCFEIRFGSYEDPKIYSGHAFMPRTYPGLGTK